MSPDPRRGLTELRSGVKRSCDITAQSRNLRLYQNLLGSMNEIGFRESFGLLVGWKSSIITIKITFDQEVEPASSTKGREVKAGERRDPNENLISEWGLDQYQDWCRLVSRAQGVHISEEETENHPGVRHLLWHRLWVTQARARQNITRVSQHRPHVTRAQVRVSGHSHPSHLESESDMNDQQSPPHILFLASVTEYL